MNAEQFTNALIHETSPYLLQHAHNPVKWLPWSEKAFQLAQEQDKPVLISIGYSSCHWCHVMEHESFEDVSTASIMNEYFICIKVDREERPDVDAIYMDAVQLMTGRGGWPLNCFVMPDQKPFYGGTYFPNAQWQDLLMKLSRFYHEQKEQCIKYADELTSGLGRLDEQFSPSVEYHFNFDTIYKVFASGFDEVDGGMNRVPKFPMPSNWEFLLQYYYHTGNEDCFKQLQLTLNKIHKGGINDQLGGGFSRYSTDALWKVPHFEKMLYDNAQFVSLYANAYRITGFNNYKKTVEETLEFIAREMTSAEGGFYSALDADSEGVEGKFYVWTKEELEIYLPADVQELFFQYYKIEEKELWEEAYILQRNDLPENYLNLTVNEIEKRIHDAKLVLRKERDKRIRPGLDDKQLCSWNAMMLKGYIDAFHATGDIIYLHTALRNANFLKDKFFIDGKLYHSYKEGRTTINGFLEDYAFLMDSFIAVYQATGDIEWMTICIQLMEDVMDSFYDEKTGMFYFTAASSEQLITRKMETQDNVINSSNSIMCRNLFALGTLSGKPEWIAHSKNMLVKMQEQINRSAPWYSGWAQAALLIQEDCYEVIICGENARSFYMELASYYLPDCILAFSEIKNDDNNLFKGRYENGKTGIYICMNNSCSQPVYTVKDAYEIISGERITI